MITPSPVIVGPKTVPVPFEAALFKTWRDTNGLDLHTGGHDSRRGKVPRLIVLHWGGLDPAHCRRVLAARGYSSHFGVGHHGAHQWGDVADRAWHAGYVNGYAIGVDICQSPEVRHLAASRERGLDVEVVRNPTARGPGQIVTLDARTAELTRRLVLALCDGFGIPLRVPRGADGLADEGAVFHGVLPRAALDGGFAGVVGHHHVSATKWDIAPWWATIFTGTELA